MKPTLQLYIEGTRIDLFKDESINIVQSIQNVRDISKVFVEFTRSFNIPASKNNNKIFEHYHNYFITDGFDARLKKDATLEINHRPYKTGKVKLDGVDLKDGKAHQYRITFFGNTIDLNDLLGDDNLSTLELSDFDTEYTVAKVKDRLTGTGNSVTYSHPDRATDIVYPRGVIAPLITHTTRLYYQDADSTDYPDANGGNLFPKTTSHQGVYWEELKYAIPVDAVIKAIEDRYSISFSNHFFSSTNSKYFGLHLWLHRKKGKAFEDTAVNKRIGNFRTNYYIDLPNVGSFGNYFLISNTNNTFQITVLLESATPFSGKITVAEGGTVRDDFTRTVENVESVTVVGNVGAGKIEVFFESSDSSITFNTDSYVKIIDLGVPDGTAIYNIQSPGFVFNNTRVFSVSEQIPDMKVIDFLTGIFKMFNLTAYSDNGTIVVKTLDDYYADETTRDITSYVDVEDSSVDSALPYKEVDLKFEGLETKLAKQHEQLSNIGWATEEYNGDNYYDANPEAYEVILPFEHMKFERLATTSGDIDPMVGWFVDDNNDPYYGKPLLFYTIKQTSATEIRFLRTEAAGSPDVEGTHFDDITSYFIPSNSESLDTTDSKFALHFKREINEYTLDNEFTETLFTNYYQDYISDVFALDRRLTTVNAYLPIKILQELELSNIIAISDKNYRINEIETDLNTSVSRLELLNQVTVVVAGVPEESEECTADSTLATVDSSTITADTICDTTDVDRSVTITGALTAEKGDTVTLTAEPTNFVGTASYLWSGGDAEGETTQAVDVTNTTTTGNITYECTVTDDSDDEEFFDDHTILWTVKKYKITLNIVNNITGSASGYNITGNQDGDYVELEEGDIYSFNTNVDVNSGFIFTQGPSVQNAQGVVGTSDITVDTTLTGAVQARNDFITITGPTQKTVNNDIPLGASATGFTPTSYTWSGGSLSNDDCVDPSNCSQVLFTETTPGTYTYSVTASDGTITATDEHVVQWSNVALIDITLNVDTSNISASGYTPVENGFTLTGDLDGTVKTQNSGTVFLFTTGIELNPGYEWVGTPLTSNTVGGTFTTSQTIDNTFPSATIQLIVYNYYIVTGCPTDATVSGQTKYIRSRSTYTVGTATTGSRTKIDGHCYFASSTANASDWATNNGITVGAPETTECTDCDTTTTTQDPCLATKSKVYLRYSSTSSVCEAAETKDFYWINGADLAQTQDNFCAATSLFTHDDCTVNAPAGFYSLDLDNKVRRYWDGSSFDVCTNCIDAQSLIFLGVGWDPTTQFCTTASGVQDFYYFDENASLMSATRRQYMYGSPADVGTTNYADTGYYTDGVNYRYFDPAEEVWIGGATCPLEPDPPACTAPTKPTLTVWRQYLECDGDSFITLGNDSTGGFPAVVEDRATGVCYSLDSVVTGNQDDDWVEERLCVNDILQYTWISYETCNDCTGTQFYSLKKCNPAPDEDEFGYRTNQSTSTITLEVNDRVSLGTDFYIVTGTTTTGINIGVVTDTGFKDCPITELPDNAFVVERQIDGWVTYVQLESGYNVGDVNITISTDGANCYDIQSSQRVTEETLQTYGVITGSCITTTTTTTTTTAACHAVLLYGAAYVDPFGDSLPGTPQNVCCAEVAAQTFYLNTSSLATATVVYLNDTCTTGLTFKYYLSDDFVNYYTWNGSTLTGPTTCPGCP